MNLDHRARRAARGLHAAAGAIPIPTTPGATVPAVVTPLGAPWMRAVTAAAAVLVVGFLAFVAQPGLLAPSSEDGPVPPVETTTTTTTEAPATTTTQAAVAAVESTTTTTTEPKPTTTTTTQPKPTTTTTAPKPVPADAITIVAPSHKAETTGSVVTVKAKVTGSMTVEINGTKVAVSGGVAEGKVKLDPGWNEIWVKGFRNGSKVAQASVKVFRVVEGTHAVKITSPGSGTETDADSITVKGTATPGLVVKVHGQEVSVAGDGTWSTTVPLAGGWNEIHAKGYLGGDRVAHDSVKVKRSVAESVPFTSHQVHGSCDENPPWDVFEGTATPGHVIKVWSEFGHASVTVGASGTFSIRVEFPGAPSGKAIGVQVKNTTTGVVHDYTFTYTGS
jgi:hypothetical protein